MCRLFGLHAGGVADAEFWLLDAPDSLDAQSHRNPDGAGIGCFGPGGRPRVDKQPIAAWQDTEFARAARHLRGSTFVAHVCSMPSAVTLRVLDQPPALFTRT